MPHSRLVPPGYGCQPHTTPQGVETYFSWLYDRLNADLDLPAPLLMHTIAFPGTEWDQSQRHEHLSHKTDAYNISYHPTVLGNAIGAWLHDVRRMLPTKVRDDRCNSLGPLLWRQSAGRPPG